MPRFQKLQWSVSGKLLKLQCQWQGVTPPNLIFPLGGKAVLEAYLDGKKVGRFGILTEAGPSTPELEETVSDIYKMDNLLLVQAAAIIYMFVEPEYRGRGIGRLALEAIAYLHAAKGCAYTVLVADDKTKNRQLVQWYERHGYSVAPKLQQLMGSPDGIYGITMIAPTATSIPEDCVIRWW